jgi:hypothetical protein
MIHPQEKEPSKLQHWRKASTMSSDNEHNPPSRPTGDDAIIINRVITVVKSESLEEGASTFWESY